MTLFSEGLHEEFCFRRKTSFERKKDYLSHEEFHGKQGDKKHSTKQSLLTFPKPTQAGIIQPSRFYPDVIRRRTHTR
jgi:hypothetical protein